MSEARESLPAIVKIYLDRGITRIDILEPSLTGRSQVNSFSKAVSAGVSRLGVPRVVIDCALLHDLSSRVLGVLLEMRKQLAARNGQLRLAAVTDPVRDVLAVTRIDQLIPVDPSVDHAIDQFAGL
jgi:anti-anti-sigma factor